MDANQKTYFIDLDGTLFDQHKKSRISARNVSAILLLKNFANVVLSTGRSFSDQRVQQAIYQLGINDVITASGAEIYIDNQLVWQRIFNKEAVEKIKKFAEDNKIIYVIFDDNGETIYTHNAIDYWLNKLFLSKKLHAIRKNKNFDFNRHKNITKIALILKNVARAKSTLKTFRVNFSDITNSYLASANYVLEITTIDANKGLSASAYCAFKGINQLNTIHIGDSMADASVKGYVGKLVAMDNGTSDLKAIADEIAPNYKNGGLYRYFISPSKSKNRK
ncbi:HAD family hydrolase [Mycoplasmopsis caviae]|uniref:COF family HAD hydrolase protein n=2 Tax=Mycoplasmopsis caviae TaxID=55603 RepID=A0A3P8L6P4_9BACT|nr:HAD-IIB family hydrolase [Mycoplasmopsis caviae]UUD35552.1 HAD family hydrolase [Mycoplasmopsis caviae]VDR41675.1 COF family HAD hydrolase protein [Mycoplasmopsis caviae]